MKIQQRRGAGAMLAFGAVMLSGCATTDIVHYRDAGAIGPYSGAVAANGFIFVSGKIGDPQTDFEQQVRDVLATIDRQLDEVGSDWSRVVQVTVYLTDMSRYSAFNALYLDHVGEPFPARVVVEVSALPAGALLEVQVTAASRDSGRSSGTHIGGSVSIRG